MRLIAQLVDDDVVDQMVPFVTENIQSQNWRQRESAVMAFGAVLEVRVCFNRHDFVLFFVVLLWGREREGVAPRCARWRRSKGWLDRRLGVTASNFDERRDSGRG